MVKQLVINHRDLYTSGVNQYFCFQYKNCIQRDVNIKLEKNHKYILERIGKVCELKVYGLNKKQLLNLIENSNCLVLNKN